jgi:AcrR family transcriptional regulator
MVESGHFGRSMRSQPQQERSKRRYAAVVEAAAELFATNGFDATTMEAIASASGSAIGSVYRFFPNKQAVFRAVAERALSAARETFEQMLTLVGAGPSWSELLDHTIDAFAKLNDEDMATRAMFTNMQLYGEYAEADAELHREFVAATTGILSVWAPSLDAATREVVANMLVMTVSGVLVLSQRESPELVAQLRTHTKLMLRRYLEPWVEDG